MFFVVGFSLHDVTSTQTPVESKSNQDSLLSSGTIVRGMVNVQRFEMYLLFIQEPWKSVVQVSVNQVLPHQGEKLRLLNYYLVNLSTDYPVRCLDHSTFGRHMSLFL